MLRPCRAFIVWCIFFSSVGFFAAAQEEKPQARPGDSKTEAAVPAATQLKLAEVEVTSAKSLDLSSDKTWSKLPDVLKGAKMYADSPTGRELQAEAKTDGIVIIAASWTYDGNESGGWYEGRTTPEQMGERGWHLLGAIVWKEKDIHQLYFRTVKKGEKIRLHTRKYNQPFLILPDAGLIAANAKFFRAKTPAVAVAKEPPADQKPDANKTGTPKPATTWANSPSVPKEIAMEAAQVSLLTGEEEWSPLPEYLRGATLLRPNTGNAIDLTVNQDVQMVIAASWAFDGNQSGEWFKGRTTLPQLVAQGWQPIGALTHKEKGAYTLFRRTLKVGEKVKFHTRKYNPPVAMLPAPDKQDIVARLPSIPFPSNDLSGIKPPSPGPEAAAAKAVLLRTHEPDPQDRFAKRGILSRELVRQAVLLAAREELGLSTRDETLRERWVPGPDSGPLPVDVVVRVQEDGRVSVTLFRFVAGKPDLLWDKEFTLQGDDLILAMTAKSESLSRQDFAAALRKAGFAGKTNAIDDNKAVPKEILITSMHFVPQFAAARQLHQLIREDGESPARLAALAEVYSHLGVLTEHLWFPGHKAFKARALLYSQRAITRWPKSATARYGRGYVFALVGLHQASLDDLAAADKLRGNETPPPWLPAVESFCRFDLKKLDSLAQEKQTVSPWLVLLAQERYGGTKSILSAADRILAEVPDCDRAIDAVYETHQLGTRGTAARLGEQRTAEMLMRRASEMGKLPAEAALVVREELAVQARDGLDEAAERRSRAALIAALRNDAKAGFDVGEPSWQSLATLIEETSFLQVERQLEFLFTGLSVPLDDARTELSPLVSGHPYRAFVDSFCDDRAERREKLTELTRTLRDQDLSLNEAFMLKYLDGNGFKGTDRLGSVMMRHQDLVYRDLLQTSRNSRELFWKEYSGHLRRVSPHSPLTIATTAEFDWEYAAPRAAQWEKEYSQSPQVQLALGKQFVDHEKYADGVRCLERAAVLMPEFPTYAALAAAWQKQKNEKKWLETWNNYLHEEDYGLSHERARVNIAEYYMLQGRWEEALPYAEAAANSGAEWTLRCSADCLTGLKRFDEAEQQMQSIADRYVGTSPIWYFWCKRTGHGDIATARTQVRDALRNPLVGVNKSYRLTFLVLEGDKEEALKQYRASLANEGSPLFAWMAAILADELKQSDVRDTCLKTVIETGNKPEYRRTFLVQLAAMSQETLVDPAKLGTMPTRVQELLGKIDEPRERCVVAYLAGKFLDLRGKKEGIELLKQAGQLAFTEPTSALAAAELRDRKVMGDK